MSATGSFVSVAIASGKGGVGKTSATVNLALALARLRHRVAILDADLALGNVDVQLGLAPEWHIGHLLAGEKTLADIMVTAPLGVRVIPASSGFRPLTALTPMQWQALGRELQALAGELDYLMIDTSAGLSDNVFEALGMASRVLVVTSPEPTSVVDAYALIKAISLARPAQEVGVLVNLAEDATEAQGVFRQLELAAERFLGRRLSYFGFVAEDASVRDAVLAQRAVVDYQPQCAASRCYRILASRLAATHAPAGRSLRLVANRPPSLHLDGGPSLGTPQYAS